MTGIQLLYPIVWWDMLLRLSLAVLMGGVVGWEREIEEKPAGLRTHMLVSLGAAMLVMAGIQTGIVQETADTISRIIQGIVTGIGFLGAGEIFSSSRNESGTIRIRGLTTAAAIWVSTALGIAAGCGLWLMCLFGAALTLLILQGLKRIEKRVLKRRDRS
ncbi:MAG: MgtC/SapB family protein [Elainellaceae cyanobacterium]